MAGHIEEGFSASVSIALEINGRIIPLSETGTVPMIRGTGYAVFRDPQDIPVGTEATLIVQVDGRELRWGIVLDDGAVPFDEKFQYRITEYPAQPCLFQMSQ